MESQIQIIGLILRRGIAEMHAGPWLRMRPMGLMGLIGRIGPIRSFRSGVRSIDHWNQSPRPQTIVPIFGAEMRFQKLLFVIHAAD